MIRGVNKRIIEINDTDSIYFEKAIFYLRPEVKELPSDVSYREAESYIDGLGLYTVPTVKPTRNYGKILVLIAAVLSAVVLIWTFTH